jgi:hypothetical protein
MIAHDVYGPIPPVTLRISVIHAGDSFTLDLPPDRLGGTIRAFEDHYGGPMLADRCMAVAAGGGW